MVRGPVLQKKKIQILVLVLQIRPGSSSAVGNPDWNQGFNSIVS